MRHWVWFGNPFDRVEIVDEFKAIVARAVKEFGGAYGNAKLRAYVKRVGLKLAAVSEEPGLAFTFTVLNDDKVNAFALPGGFVDLGETVEDACRRELLEETGLAAVKIALIGVYSDPLRDPRGPTVSVAYLAEIEGRPTAGDDAAAAVWVAGWQRKVLAFDHRQILEAASKRWRRRSMSRGGKRK